MASGAGRRKADAKVIILGDYNVGKTSLIGRYMDGKFSPHEATIGAAFFLKQWGSYNVAVWIYLMPLQATSERLCKIDTAGDERYTGLSSFYCRNAQAAILAFDLNTASTFESLWVRFLPLLEHAKDDCLRVVVGCKHDALDQQNREISIEDAVTFAREINTNVDLSKIEGEPYFETSSKNGYNVTKVFEYLFQYCLPVDGDGRSRELDKSTVELTDSGTKGKSCCR